MVVCSHGRPRCANRWYQYTFQHLMWDADIDVPIPARGSNSSGGQEPSPDAIAMLSDMGFTESHARSALRETVRLCCLKWTFLALLILIDFRGATLNARSNGYSPTPMLTSQTTPLPRRPPHRPRNARGPPRYQRATDSGRSCRTKDPQFIQVTMSLIYVRTATSGCCSTMKRSSRRTRRASRVSNLWHTCTSLNGSEGWHIRTEFGANFRWTNLRWKEQQPCNFIHVHVYN